MLGEWWSNVPLGAELRMQRRKGGGTLSSNPVSRILPEVPTIVDINKTQQFDWSKTTPGGIKTRTP